MNHANEPDSVFRLVLLAAKRAEQLMEGAKPRLSEHGCVKPTTLGLKEVEAGLVPWQVLSPEEYERLREEELAQRERERERVYVPPPPPAVSFAEPDEEEEEEEELEELPDEEELRELEGLADEELLAEEE